MYHNEMKQIRFSVRRQAKKQVNVIEQNKGGKTVFVSVYFPIFLSILIICFFCVRVKWRAGVLLLASYLFCAYLSVNAAVVLFLTTVLTWLFGMLLENKLDEGKKKQGKVLLGIITAVYLAVLMGYK